MSALGRAWPAHRLRCHLQALFVFRLIHSIYREMSSNLYFTTRVEHRMAVSNTALDRLMVCVPWSSPIRFLERLVNSLW